MFRLPTLGLLIALGSAQPASAQAPAVPTDREILRRLPAPTAPLLPAGLQIVYDDITIVKRNVGGNRWDCDVFYQSSLWFWGAKAGTATKRRVVQFPAPVS